MVKQVWVIVHGLLLCCLCVLQLSHRYTGNMQWEDIALCHTWQVLHVDFTC